MSLLTNQTNINEDKYFFSTGGGGGSSSAPIVIFGNSSPISWFKSFSPPSDLLLNIQNFTVPTYTTDGKLVVTANWTINSNGQDAVMYCKLDGSYEVSVETTTIQSGKGIFGQTMTMTYDYTANTEDWSMIQVLELDTGASAVDVSGFATLSVIFYPTP